MKHYLLKTAAVLMILLSVISLASCDSGTDSEKTGKKHPKTTETTVEATETAPAAKTTDGDPALPATTPTAPETTPETTPDKGSDMIAKINGAADDVGIYAVVVRLDDKAADKGTFEMVYYGAKGTPQENSVVNTFRIEYWKNDDGTFEIRTFYDGEVYQNQHKKDTVKVTNEFGAALRAGSVIITYTPDGGETVEIFRATADYFR